MSIISYTLEETLFTFAALSAIHTVPGFQLFQLGAVTGIAVLCTHAGVTAVAAVFGLVALVALTALAAGAVFAFIAVIGGSCGFYAVTGAVTAVCGVHQQVCVGQLIAVLCAKGFHCICKHSHPALKRQIKRALC